MQKSEDFPIWTRNRARRHIARGCSPRFVGLIIGRTRRPPPSPTVAAPPSNVLPFRVPDIVRRVEAAVPGAESSARPMPKRAGPGGR